MHPSDGRPPGVATVALGARVSRVDTPALCHRLAALLRHRRPALVICDVGAIVEPDAATLDALARLALTAGRLGCRMHLGRARRPLRALLAFTGLGEVLPLHDGPLIEVRREPEQREQPLGVEEVVDPPDPPG
ncbi:MAG TPA: STAS domain-containing protein [Micromonosporaceae bacterium]|nr:STAS domain-containing protein [Micromonosporaceae bacterium]